MARGEKRPQEPASCRLPPPDTAWGLGEPAPLLPPTSHEAIKPLSRGHRQVLEALNGLLKHHYARGRVCAALRLAAQLGGAAFGKEQRGKLDSWHSRAQNFT